MSDLPFLYGLVKAITWTRTTAWLASAATLYVAVRSVYRLLFHPLSRFPGPKLAAVSEVWYAYHWMSGRYHWDIETMHMVYGDVVRIAPNELSFATGQSFNDIYGHATKDRRTFVKGTFYELGQPEPGVVAERSPVNHRDTRRLLSHGFGAKALQDQEDLLHQHCDLFASQLRKHSVASPDGLNTKEWFNKLSFDVIGELAFGESFGAVASGM